MTERFVAAVNFATKKHDGQFRFDKKTPYITHPMAVAEIIAGQDWPEWVVVAAVLHDTIEDTDTTQLELANAFGQQVANHVRALSKNNGEDYVDYIKRIEGFSKEARAIKLADLQHNLSDLKKGSMRDKYMLATHILKGYGAPKFPPFDWLAYLEMARYVLRPATSDCKGLLDHLDISDEEAKRLRDQLEEAMNRDG